MVRRLLVVGLLAVTIAAAITWFAGRDDGSDESVNRTLEDENGCATGIYANTDFRLDPDEGGDLTVCHFEKQPLRDEPSYVLDRSQVLTSDQSARLRRVISAAPRGKQQFTGCDVASEDGPGEFFLLVTADPDSVPFWVYNGACGENGVLAVNAKGKPVNRLDTARVLKVLGSTYGPLGPETG